ncbi:MAG: glycosyltransferase family 9 protein [Nitrospiria bacterium]
MILTRPFFVELKKAFPNAMVTISVLDHYMRGIPGDLVDKIHVVHRADKHQHSLKEKIRNLRELGNHDIIFDLADTSRSLLLCLLNKAQLKIGFPYRSVYRYLLYDAAIFRSDLIFEADLLLHALNLLGISTSFPPDFGMTGTPCLQDSPYLVYFAGASTPLKRWPPENFKALLFEMSGAYPEYEHIILKGIGDKEAFTEIFEAFEDRLNIKSVEIDKLEKTIAFIQGATMVISNDTGIRHVSIAVHTPTVGIFFGKEKGSTQPYRYWPRYGNHEIVFNLDGTPPSAEKVFAAATTTMATIQRVSDPC